LDWNDGESTRSRGELLDRTVRRGEHLRRRRRLAWVAAAPLALLLIAVPLALARSDGGGERTTVAAAGGGAPVSTLAPETTVAPPFSLPTVPSLPPTSSSATPPARPSPTTRPPQTATTARAATATTAPPPLPTTSSTIDDGRPPGPECEPSMFQTSLTFEKASYRPGETVRGTATFRNTSGRTCYSASYFGGTDVLDATGAQLTPGVRYVADAFEWTPMAAGESQTRSVTWDQQDCRAQPSTPCPQAPPGTYTVAELREPFGTARATVQLIAG